MIHSLNSIPAIETVLIRLSIRQKQFIYQITRLDYRIFKKLAMLEIVKNLILEEEQNIKSLNAAIIAARKGKISEKLTFWKVKAEYKLFKLNLRKSKIDPVKLILDQSKLEQLKQALASLEIDISYVIAQKQNFSPAIEENHKDETLNENIFTFFEKTKQIMDNDPVKQSIKIHLKNALKMAS